MWLARQSGLPVPGPPHSSKTSHPSVECLVLRQPRHEPCGRFFLGSFYLHSKAGAKLKFLSKIQSPIERSSFKSMVSKWLGRQIEVLSYPYMYVTLRGQNSFGLFELDGHRDLPIVSADISADRYLQNFVLSAFLPMGSLSADIPLYRQIWLLSADKSLISDIWCLQYYFVDQIKNFKA